MIKKQTLIELAASICNCGDSAEESGMVIGAHFILKSVCGDKFAWRYRDTIHEIDNYLFDNKLALTEAQLISLISKERFFDWMDTL